MNAKNEVSIPSGAFSLFSKSKDIVIKNIRVFAVLYIIPFIFSLRLWVEDGYRGDNIDIEWGYEAAIAVVAFLVLLIAAIIVQIMLMAAELEGSRGKLVKLNTVWEKTKKMGWRIVGLFIVAGLVVLGGLVLLIIPGIIMIRRYFLSPYVMLDKNTGIRESMRISAAISKPYSDSIYGVIGVLILISIIGIVPYIGPLVSLVLGALYSVAPALRYQELKKIAKG